MSLDVEKLKNDINAVVDVCVEMLPRLQNEENYFEYILLLLGNKAEKGDIDAIVKIAVITKIMEELEKIKC